MDARIPTEIKPLLQEFSEQLNLRAPGLCAGLYIVGSIALGDFAYGQSDIDLVGIRAGTAAVEDQAALLSVHEMIQSRFPRWKCDAVYFSPGKSNGIIATVE